MKHIRLGRSGLRVSRLCLGTMNFGPHTSDEDSFVLMDRALDLGINFFDTADVYGWKSGEGVTERILGRWFAQGASRRERVVLATKVYGDMRKPALSDPDFDRGLSARKIILGCENSLRRMQTDWIDLYQMHHIDRSCPFDEIWTAMETLVRQGKVICVGSSNFAGWDIATAQQTAAHRHFPGLISEQSHYNLAQRTVELEVLPACLHYGLGMIPWSPLAGGLLGGALAKQAQGRRGSEHFQKEVENRRAQIDRYEALCRNLGEAPADVSLAWLLRNPAVSAPIIGPRSIEQLNGALRALEISLSEETIAELDKIWPGPGGSAPDVYSW